MERTEITETGLELNSIRTQENMRKVFLNDRVHETGLPRSNGTDSSDWDSKSDEKRESGIIKPFRLPHLISF